MSFFRKSGIVNVKMVITEEKILSNIDKIQKLINPNSKKAMVQLEEDKYFRDLVESVKTYLIEYPKKKNFPADVYKAAYDLVEYATNQFEENTKKVEDLIRKRERNIKLASILRNVLKAVQGRSKNWKKIVEKLQKKYPKDVVEALNIIGSAKTSEETESDDYKASVKLVKAKINNLESNTFVEIDKERIEDKSKALSYIGIEIAEALKYIPVPAKVMAEKTVNQFEKEEEENFIEETVEKQENVETIETTKATTPKKAKKAVQEKATSEILQEVLEEKKAEEVVKAKAKTKAKAKVAAIQILDTGDDEEEEEEIVEYVEETNEPMDAFLEETRFEEKPSLWQRIKNSKFVRTIKYIMQIRVVLDYPALPEGRGE